MTLIKILLVLMMSYLFVSLIIWKVLDALSAIKSLFSGPGVDRVRSLSSLLLSSLLLIIFFGSIRPFYELIMLTL